MSHLLGKIIGWITSGALDRVLDTVDRKVAAETDKEAIKGEIIKAHYASRAGWMKAGGFILMLLFAIPLAVHFAAVIAYSILWCAGCAYPRDWTIAALPAPLDEWSGVIIVSIFGVVGVTALRK